MKLLIHGQAVNGVDIDGETRCVHYHGDLDIIAIKFKCCGQWFPCFKCHREIADHEAAVWPLDEQNGPAILCGKCGRQLSVEEYAGCDSTCPGCQSKFNPGCTKHFNLYFAPLTR